MGLIGSALGGALGIGASIFGAVSASKAMKNIKSNLQNQMGDYQNWYDRNYNEDATQRADAQRILSITDEQIRKRNKEAAGAQAMGGGTEESVAASKAANSQAMAEAASQIAVAGQNRKDQVEQQYMAAKSDLNDKLNNLEQAKAQNVAQAAQGAAEAGAGMASFF